MRYSNSINGRRSIPRRVSTNNRLASIAIVFLLVTAGFIGFITFESNVVSAGSTIYVGSGPGNDTAYIGEAIAVFASPGDTVFVHSGVYYDNLIIDKTINLTGEDRNTTIIDGCGGKVVQISSTDWMNISGFTFMNGSDGIWTIDSSNSTFINNIVHDQENHGFFFSGTPYSNNKIIGNVVYNIEGDGIHLEDQTSVDEITFWNNSIINNTVYNNTGDGIFINLGTSNFIIDNIVHHNGLGSINPNSGIRICASQNNVVMGNTVHDNDNGIELSYSTPSNPLTLNIIAGNTIYNNDIGIRVRDAQDNTFIGNVIFNNNYSVYLISVIDPNVCYGSDFINCSLTNATIGNVYMENSGDNSFINCTLSNASKYEFNLTDDSHAILLNTTFDKDRVYYGDTLSDLIVKWYMHVKVIYYNGTPVSNADIWVNDSYGITIFKGQADSKGWARWLVITEYIEQDMNGDHIGERTYYTPHDAAATDGELWGYALPNMDISKVVLIILGAPQYILPPTNLTTKVVNDGNSVELEWEPPLSPALDHYLIYRADSATGFDFAAPYNISTTWADPLNTTWVDPDPNITTLDNDFYYIVRAANYDESDVSVTSNTAGVWTRSFQGGVSTFSLPLEPFVKKDTEFYCQDMNASYIKWMNTTTHTWMKHDRGSSENITLIEVGEGYEIGFLGKSIQTKYTFTGMPGAMIVYDDDSGFSGFDPDSEAKNLTVSVDVEGNVTLTWEEPGSMSDGWYEVYYSNTRDGFFGTPGIHYDLACPSIGFGTNTATISGLGASDPGTRLYFMVVPFNASGVRGASTYSIGIWTEEYLDQYDTFGMPLKLSNYHTSDWYCDNIPETVGINYYEVSAQRWSWHSTRMPEGAFDPVLEMSEGYQISTSDATIFIFIGI